MNVQEYISKILPGMEGWCTPEKAAKLAEYAANAQTFVEIGVFGGRSLFAGALAQPGHLSNRHPIAIGIDPWKAEASVEGFSDANADWWVKLDHDAIYKACRVTLDVLELKDQCYMIRCTALEALPLVYRLAPIDLLHIDGNHSEASALADVENYVPLVREGGIVFMDDIDWETTKKAKLCLEGLCSFIEPVNNCGIYRRKPSLNV